MDTDDANANSNAAAENNDIMIKLISAEDDSTGESQVFEISLAAAGLSVLVVDAAGDVEDDDDDDDDDNARNKPPLEINISRVKGPCLAKVVDFMNHHHTDKMKAIPTPLGGSSFNEVSLFFLLVCLCARRTVPSIVSSCIVPYRTVLYCIDTILLTRSGFILFLLS